MRFSSGRKKLFVAGVAGAIASTVIASPGFAYSESCSVGYSGTCQTYTVSANSSGHWVKYSVCAGGVFNSVAYEIYDSSNGVVVKKGSTSSLGCTSGQVNGLYGWAYRLRLGGSNGANGTLRNT